MKEVKKENRDDKKKILISKIIKDFKAVKKAVLSENNSIKFSLEV